MADSVPIKKIEIKCPFRPTVLLFGVAKKKKPKGKKSQSLSYALVTLVKKNGKAR